MKKIFLVLALFATLQFASAQDVKSPAAAKAAVEKAQIATENPKQNTKTATWIKYGQAIMDAYSSPSGNVLPGMGMQEVALLNGNEKPSSEEQVVVGGQPMIKQVFDRKNLYFDREGKLSVVEVTKPIVENALDKALEAYSQAAKLDAGGQKTKDISAALKNISTKYTEEAYSLYTLGKYAESSVDFEKAFNAAGTAPCSELDTNSVYNTAFTAMAAGDNDRAKTFLEKCLSYNYYGSEGDVFARLAMIAEAANDKEASKNYLEEGFTKFPQSQSILIGLINFYVSSGENTDRLFELIENAKKNEPNNASLYRVEGDIYDKLGNEEAALAAWDKCIEINPDFEFGLASKGIHYYNKAIDLQEKASNEMDDAKYNALISEFEASLKSCVEPFEKAFELTKDDSVKASIAEYLKNVCFRFRDDPEFAAKYEKYSQVQ